MQISNSLTSHPPFDHTRMMHFTLISMHALFTEFYQFQQLMTAPHKHLHEMAQWVFMKLNKLQRLASQPSQLKLVTSDHIQLSYRFNELEGFLAKVFHHINHDILMFYKVVFYKISTNSSVITGLRCFCALNLFSKNIVLWLF